MQKVLIIIGLALSLQGFCEEENPIYMAMERDYQAAGEKWDEFRSVLSWHLESVKPDLIEPSNEEEKLSASLFNEKWTKEYALLEETLNDINAQFYDFRRQLSEALTLRYNGITAQAMYASVMKEATDWYVSLVEAYLLPADWKKEYTAYLENKKSDAQDEL